MAKNPDIRKFDMEFTPFSHHRLYGDEKYSLQNMVLKMVDYPARLDSSLDQYFSIYVDRARTEWSAAQQLITSESSGDAWFVGVSDEDFLFFAGKLFALLNTHIPCTGDDIVKNAYRYSNLYRRRLAELSGSKALASLDADGYDNPDLRSETREWAEKAAAEDVGPLPITGALMVRMTDGGGYPCPVLMGVIQKSKFARYSGNSAPFIKGAGF
jgi:hypothetical protein